MEQLNRAEYVDAVKAIKEAIQISRYRAAKLVNKEVSGRCSFILLYESFFITLQASLFCCQTK